MTIESTRTGSSRVPRVRDAEPIEYEGTYPLPEAQLDRFLVRISIGYPAREHEIEMLERRLERGVDEVELTPVVDGETLWRCSARSSRCTSPRDRGLRRRPRDRDARVASARGRREPAGSLALVKLSRAKAAMAGRDFVTPEDVKAVAVPALRTG